MSYESLADLTARTIVMCKRRFGAEIPISAPLFVLNNITGNLSDRELKKMLAKNPPEDILIAWIASGCNLQ